MMGTVPADHVSGRISKREEGENRDGVYLPLIIKLAPPEGLPTSQSGIDAKLGETQRKLTPLRCLERTHCCAF